MSDFVLIQCADDVALAHAAAGDWLNELEAANQSAAFYGVALSGGRIARRFFAAVVEQAKARRVSFALAHFFWADERCVPADDPDSNYGMARRLLLLPLGIQESQAHRIRAEEPAGLAVAAADGEIRRLVPLDNAGQPVLDMVFLGMGEDGHVASLFPGEPAERATGADLVYRAVIASKPPARRITIGFAALAAAKQVWVLASGSGKQAALRDSLRPEGQTPLAEVLRRRRRMRIYTDCLQI